jgi:hypothetical protein
MIINAFFLSALNRTANLPDLPVIGSGCKDLFRQIKKTLSCHVCVTLAVYTGNKISVVFILRVCDQVQNQEAL